MITKFTLLIYFYKGIIPDTADLSYPISAVESILDKTLIRFYDLQGPNNYV